MKVLQLAKFYPPPFGGIETHVLSILDSLAGQVEFNLVVANTAFRSEQFAHNRTPVHRVPSLGQLASTSFCPGMPGLVRTLHRKQQFDLVHVHLPNPMAHAATLLLPRTVPVIATWHSDILKKGRLLRLYEPHLNRFVQRCTRILVTTPTFMASTQQLNAPGVGDKTEVVPLGINVSALQSTAASSALAARFRESEGLPIIFALGRHVEYKGFEYLIRAMHAIPNAVLWLGGSGPLTPQLKDLAMPLKERVRFLGNIPPGELAARHHAADIFCLPSVTQQEAFGIAMAEAMSCGKPVVCCELNNGVTFLNRDGETGLVAPPRDPDALARAINRLLGEPALARSFGIAARDRVLANFSADAMASSLLPIYRQVAHRQP